MATREAGRHARRQLRKHPQRLRRTRCCARIAHLAREYHADGFWCDGYAPGHLHTYDAATRRLFRDVSGGKEIPTKLDPVHDPVARQYLAWHEQYFVDLADRMRGSIRAENPDAVLFANYSANRTWYFPEMYMGEYPAAYCRAVDVSSVELYWDVPGDALYQQFCCAFLQGVTSAAAAARSGFSRQRPALSGVCVAGGDPSSAGSKGAPWGIYPESRRVGRARGVFQGQHSRKCEGPRRVVAGSQSQFPYIGIVSL